MTLLRTPGGRGLQALWRCGAVHFVYAELLEVIADEQQVLAGSMPLVLVPDGNHTNRDALFHPYHFIASLLAHPHAATVSMLTLALPSGALKATPYWKAMDSGSRKSLLGLSTFGQLVRDLLRRLALCSTGSDPPLHYWDAKHLGLRYALWILLHSLDPYDLLSFSWPPCLQAFAPHRELFLLHSLLARGGARRRVNTVAVEHCIYTAQQQQ